MAVSGNGRDMSKQWLRFGKTATRCVKKECKSEERVETGNCSPRMYREYRSDFLQTAR
jgi:hypothetical protein